MSFFDKLFRTKKSQPEDEFIVTLTNEQVTVSYHKWPTTSVKWKDINTILLINTDEGPLLPDVWLTLISDDSKCMIPQGSKGFDDVYEIVSKYEGI